MSKAKDRTQPLAPWMVTCLGLTLSLVESGCSSMTGFRSVGTERPSFFSFWDRSSQASPTPENDAYVLSMRAGQARSDALARRDDGGPDASGRSDGADSPGEKLAVGTDPTRKGTGAVPKRRGSPDDSTIRVSLGRPEPLPGLAKGSAVNIASKGSASQWKADGKNVARRPRRHDCGVGRAKRQRRLGTT